jgi:ligand-binding sensor domain-containing protein
LGLERRDRTSAYPKYYGRRQRGNLWIGNNGMGVLKYDGKKVVNFTEEQKLKKDSKGNSLDRVFSIGEDASGNIWFGTVEFGAWRYNGNSVKKFYYSRWIGE